MPIIKASTTRWVWRKRHTLMRPRAPAHTALTNPQHGERQRHLEQQESTEARADTGDAVAADVEQHAAAQEKQ
ncbi:hypothetical protein ACFWZ3_10240 [Frateuria sp. GZRR35]|uniref:hypothetical protein n=1 Tax=Frateuria sp. GZRR35 TaxID=3351536 RepID=UPI003EDB6DDF